MTQKCTTKPVKGPWQKRARSQLYIQIDYYLQLNIAAENGLFMDDLPIYIY
jgi:hypothetical protein